MLINYNLIADYHIITMILINTCLMGLNGLFGGFYHLKVLYLTATETTSELVMQITEKCMNIGRTKRELNVP